MALQNKAIEISKDETLSTEEKTIDVEITPTDERLQTNLKFYKEKVGNDNT